MFYIKAALNMWNPRRPYARYLKRITLDQAIRKEALVISDERLGSVVSGRRGLSHEPHPIWRQEPEKILLRGQDIFGYGVRGSYIYYGPAPSLLSSRDKTNPAMSGQPGKPSKHLGGIEFNSNRLNLQLQNSGQAIRFHLDPAMLKQLQNAPGFTPVIIKIQPMTNLKLWLGINDKPANQMAGIESPMIGRA